MHLSSLGRQLVAWIACAAILLGSMAPLATQALERTSRGAPDQGWVEVCTAMGTMRVDTGDSAPDGPAHKAPADHAQQHCAFCSSHTTALGMPPAAPASMFVPALRPGLPELFLKSPRPLFAWSTAQPRAPPPAS
jgi:hypothetical protein